MKKIKILHIVGNMNMGGTETMLMNIYRNINREKVQFDFIYYNKQDSYYDQEIKKLGGKIIVVSSSKSVRELIKVIKENGPYEVVHAHTLFNSGVAMLASKLCGVKTRIVHAHTTLEDNSSLIKKIYTQCMKYLINSYSSKILACSKEAGKFLFGDEEIKKSKYNYFPNLINYEDLINCPKEEVKRFKDEYDLNDSMVIGHIGTFKESKNHKFLLEITRYLKESNININLLLVGDGELRNNLEDLVNEYSIYDNVKFVGIRKDINVMLHSMNVFVFPSIYEGLGLVLLEAQAAGLPCIVSEAIQLEADLKLGLVTQLNLLDGIEKWSNKIVERSSEKEIDIDKINKAFDDNEYSTEKCINKLMQIYNIEDRKVFN